MRCKHPFPFLANQRPSDEGDTVELDYRCFRCKATWTEEVTVGDLARGKEEAERRLDEDEAFARVYEENQKAVRA